MNNRVRYGFLDVLGMYTTEWTRKFKKLVKSTRQSVHCTTSGDLTKTKKNFTAKTIDLGSYLKVYAIIKKKN